MPRLHTEDFFAKRSQVFRVPMKSFFYEGGKQSAQKRKRTQAGSVCPILLYRSVLVTKLINSIMLDGKKGVAQKVVYSAFDIVKEQTGKEPLEVFTAAMENIMPSLEVKARRVGGATYQVPMEVRPERRQTLGLRWLTTYARKRSEQHHEGAPGRRADGRRQQRRQRREEA